MTINELDLDPERRRAIRRRVGAAVTAFVSLGDRRAARRLGDAWRDNPDDLDQWERHLAGVEATLRRRGGLEIVRHDRNGDPI